MSLQIATIRQIPIRLHFSLVLVFFLISWTLAIGIMPHYAPGLSQLNHWIMSITGTIILFLSVLVHELSHSMVARSYGIKSETNNVIYFWRSFRHRGRTKRV